MALEVIELLKRTVLIGWVLLIPPHKSFLRLLVGMLTSILYLLILLFTKPFVDDVDDLFAAASSSVLVFLFFGALLIRTYDFISQKCSPSAAKALMSFVVSSSAARTGFFKADSIKQSSDEHVLSNSRQLSNFRNAYIVQQNSKHFVWSSAAPAARP